MVILRRKTWRDIRDNKGVYLACMIVIAIGLIVYTSMSMVLENLQEAQKSFYQESNFADGFITLTGYPQSKVRSLEAIDGVEEVEGRIVKDVRIAGNKESPTKYLKLVSIDLEHGQRINKVTLVEGRLPTPNFEMLVDPKFFTANKLMLEDSLSIILDGKQTSFSITGTAQSPEFIYAMKNSQDLYPDSETFGIAYVPLKTLNSLIIEKGQVNDIVFTLEAEANFETVKGTLQTELKKYGLQSIIPRKNQTSHAILDGELTSLKGTTKTLPVVFLGVSTIILYTMLRRLIEQQRVQIGTLKAFGLKNSEIVLHYLSYPIFIGSLGGLLGGLSGIALAQPLTTLYKEFFALPGLQSSFSIKYLFMGLLLSLVFSLLSGIKGSLDILRLDPAEGMRPPAPKTSHKTIVERFSSLWQILSSQTQMGIRNAFRSPTRSLFTVIGIAVVYSLMTVSWSLESMTKLMTIYQLEEVQKYDAKVMLSRPLPAEATQRILEREKTVSKVEPLLEVPASLKKEWLKKDVAIMGLTENSTLYNIIDKDGNHLKVPEQGILLSERLAQLLKANVGDSIYVESPWRKELSDEKGEYLRVSGVIPQYVGLNAFMKDNELQNFLRQGKISTSMLLQMDEEAVKDLKDKYKDAENVAVVESLSETSKKMLEMMETYGFTTWILAILGGIAGFALIYNSSIISLSERQRELASLRVLGMTPQEVLRVITSEQWSLCLLGIILGIPLAYGLQSGMSKAVSTDIFTIPSQLPPIALLGAAMGTGFSVWIAQTRAYRRILKLPFIEILATRD